MSRTRMWIFETDQYGCVTNQKFCIDEPIHIPRIGEFIDSDRAGGWVRHVQYMYNHLPNDDEFGLIINVSLSKTK